MHRVSIVSNMRDLINKHYITAKFVFFKFLGNIFLEQHYFKVKKKTQVFIQTDSQFKVSI